MFTIECEIIKWCVDFQCFTQCCCSSVSDAVICWFVTDATTWMTNECKKGSRVLTSQIEVNECWVCLQYFTKCCCSSVSDVVICSFNEEWKKKNHETVCERSSTCLSLHSPGQYKRALCLTSRLHSKVLSLHLRYQFLLIYGVWKEWCVDDSHLQSLLCLRSIQRATSVEFDFNASLNDFTPASSK